MILQQPLVHLTPEETPWCDVTIVKQVEALFLQQFYVSTESASDDLFMKFGGQRAWTGLYNMLQIFPTEQAPARRHLRLFPFLVHPHEDLTFVPARSNTMKVRDGCQTEMSSIKMPTETFNTCFLSLFFSLKQPWSMKCTNTFHPQFLGFPVYLFFVQDEKKSGTSARAHKSDLLLLWSFFFYKP